VAWAVSDKSVNNGAETHCRSHPYTVALTGGIASGKTLVSDAFATLGVPVIDTDVIARKLVEPEQPALKEIEQAFGSKVIDRSGKLKRSEMRSIIFSDPEKRRKLEAILHPKIKQYASDAVAGVSSAYCILVIPLLADRGSYPFINRVLVVDVDPETQIKRLIARDHCTREQATQALAAQFDREQRLKIADDVLVNASSPEQARQDVKLLNEKYTRLASFP